MTEQKGWRIRQTAHDAAHDYAQKEATRNARKALKAIQHLYGFSHKLVRETVYKSTYDAFYRDRFQEELIDQILREMDVAPARIAEHHPSAIDTGRDLSALFGLDPGTQQ